MKKLSYLVVGVVALVMASCQKPSEKAAGTYSGNYVVFSVSNPGNAVISANGEKVDLTVNITTGSGTVTANAIGVAADASGDNVALTYTSSSTTDGDITGVSGTVTGNSLTMNVTYRAGGSPYTAAFTGTK